MPSFPHEGIIQLFRDRPELAPEVLRDVLHVELPEYTHARVESADLTNIKPAARHADLVVLLESKRPELGIVVEVQLEIDRNKEYTWPEYITGLRSRLRREVELLVVTSNPRVAEWAAGLLKVGRGRIPVSVFEPASAPRVTDPQDALRYTELAVLSAVAHGNGPVEEALPIATAALTAVARYTDQRGMLYSDLIMAALSAATARALEALMQTGKYEFQSEFARRFLAEGEAKGKAEGEAKGKAEGKAEAVLRILDKRGVAVTAAQREHIATCTDISLLDEWFDRALTANTANDVLGDSASH